jgi:hypothetical protein
MGIPDSVLERHYRADSSQQPADLDLVGLLQLGRTSYYIYEIVEDTLCIGGGDDEFVAASRPKAFGSKVRYFKRVPHDSA